MVFDGNSIFLEKLAEYRREVLQGARGPIMRRGGHNLHQQILAPRLLRRLRLVAASHDVHRARDGKNEHPVQLLGFGRDQLLGLVHQPR